MGQSERKRLMEEIQTLMRSREATEKVLESKTSTIQALEAELSSQSSSHSPLIESMQTQLKESQHLISDLGANVNSLQKTLLDKDSDHDKIMKDKDNELQQLKNIIVAKDAEIAELTEKLREADANAQKLGSQLSDYADKDIGLEELNAKIVQMNADKEKSNVEIRSLKNQLQDVAMMNVSSNGIETKNDDKSFSLITTPEGSPRKSLSIQQDSSLWNNLSRGLFFDRNSHNKKRNSTGSTPNTSTQRNVNSEVNINADRKISSTAGNEEANGVDPEMKPIVIPGDVSFSLPPGQSPFKTVSPTPNRTPNTKMKDKKGSITSRQTNGGRRNSYTGIHIPFYLGTADLARVGTMLVAFVRGYLTRKHVHGMIKNIPRVYFCTLKSAQGLNSKEKQSVYATINTIVHRSHHRKSQGHHKTSTSCYSTGKTGSVTVDNNAKAVWKEEIRQSVVGVADVVVNIFCKNINMIGGSDTFLGQTKVCLDDHPEFFSHETIEFHRPLKAATAIVYDEEGKPINVNSSNKDISGSVTFGLRMPPFEGNMCGWFWDIKEKSAILGFGGDVSGEKIWASLAQGNLLVYKVSSSKGTDVPHDGKLLRTIDCSKIVDIREKKYDYEIAFDGLLISVEGEADCTW